MATGKRSAEALPSEQKRKDKKQKIAAAKATSTPKPTSRQTQEQTLPKAAAIAAGNATGSSSGRSFFPVVPATPGTIVDLPALNMQKLNTGEDPKATKERQPKQQPSQAPLTLPLEPHATILSDLQPKYTVRVLSVISSTSMEKRIKAVLEHMASQPTTDSITVMDTSKQTLATPGVVLLHARASDAGKLVSIAEIVKRRVRDGHFNTDQAAATDLASGRSKNSKKKNKQGKGLQLSTSSWYQYNRIYDVETISRKGQGKDKDNNKDKDGDDDGDEWFEPMKHRFREAIGDFKASKTVTMTYMSIILSRTPLIELHKNPEISIQSSNDSLEVEYEQWMADS